MVLFHIKKNCEQQMCMILKPASSNFLGPLHGGLRLFAETWGSFLLAQVAADGAEQWGIDESFGSLASTRSGGWRPQHLMDLLYI